MNKGTVVLLMVVVLGGGYGLGRLVTGSKGGSGASAAKVDDGTKGPTGPSDGVDRVRIPLEGAAKGPANAKVNIVIFSDFQCPFCSRVVPTIQKIEKEYSNNVRLFFRHNPLPMHPDAPLAAEAAVAAEAQGKFWEMHDKLFANQQALKRPDLEKYAGEIGLDVGKF
jgi:protein-disulfide isomerase